MRRVWDAIAVIIVTLFVITIVFRVVQPYIPLILLGLFVWLIGERVLHHYRNW